MRRRLIYRKSDGHAVLTIRAEREHSLDGWQYDDPELPEIRDFDNGDADQLIHVGDEGTLVVVKTQRSPYSNAEGLDDVFLHAGRNGVPGNVNPNETRHHGWRGTTNMKYLGARGWRRVESVNKLSRGVGYRIVFSADLMPNED